MPNLETRPAVVGSIVLLLLVAPLNSQSQYSFDLDVPAARSSFWGIDDLSKANELSADLEIRELRGDSRWIPAFHLALGAGNQTIALRLVRENGERDVTVALITTESGKLTGQRTISGWKLRKGQRFQITLDWSVPGTLSVANSGTEVGRVPLAFTPQSLKISASTGQLFGHALALTTK